MIDYSHIIWDFNGTILNDVEAGIKSENTLLTRRKMPLIESVEHYHSVFTFPIIEYYKKLGHNFENESYDDLAEEWVAEYLKNSKISKLQDGVIDLLEYFKNKKCKQIILSATEQKMLVKQVECLGISNYFDEILGLDNIHAYSKIEIAKSWLEKEKPRKTLLIGDTVHDYQVAQDLCSDCILVAIGHQSYKTLLSCKVPVCHYLSEINEDKN